MSTASGLPDFRSQTGLWRQRPERLATLDALRETPDEFYFFYQWRLLNPGLKAQPNPGHTILAELEAENRLHMLITQNVDGLHHKAGSKNIAEIHGSLRTVSCLDCLKTYDSSQLLPEQLPADSSGYKHGRECLCPHCGGYLRPDVVLFGEQLPRKVWEEAAQAAKRAELMIVLGSSLQVGPANQLPYYTLDAGGKFIIINNDATPLDGVADVVINADIVQSLQEIKQLLGA